MASHPTGLARWAARRVGTWPVSSACSTVAVRRETGVRSIVSVRRCRRLSHVAREWIFVRAAATISLSDTSPPFPVSWDTDSLNRRTRVRETTAGIAEASPITHVSPDDPPLLMLHGELDEIVPLAQAERMEEVFRKVGVAVSLLSIPGGGHDDTFGGVPNLPDYVGAMVEWFDEYLPSRP